MNNDTEKFIEHCKRNLQLDTSVSYNYHSMSVCLVDCIYSLRASYDKVTIPIVDRYAAAYMKGNKYADGDNLEDLFKHIRDCGGKEEFVKQIIKNRQKLAGVPKAEVLENLAIQLLTMNINTMEDFKVFPDQDYLEYKIYSIRGIGDSGVNYLFMLAGDPDRCKPDVHVHRFISEACGHDVSNREVQQIFTEAVNVLKNDNPDLTVRQLDGIIWKKSSQKK